MDSALPSPPSFWSSCLFSLVFISQALSHPKFWLWQAQTQWPPPQNQRVCPSFAVHLSTLIPVTFLGGKYGHAFTQLWHTPCLLSPLPIPKSSILYPSQPSFNGFLFSRHTHVPGTPSHPTSPTQPVFHFPPCMLCIALPAYPAAKPHYQHFL